MPRVLVVGDVIDDVLVAPRGPIGRDTDTPARIELRAGGSAANVAAWLGVAGAEVDFVGTVAAADVDRHSALLSACGVTPRLRASTEPTGTIVVLLDGDARTMLTSRGANDATGPDAVTDELLAAAGHLHLTGYSLYSAGGPAWTGVLRRAAAGGATVSVDPSSTAPLEAFGVDRFLTATAGADIVLPNLDEGRLLTGAEEPDAIADRLLEHYRVVVLTRGADGVLVRTRSGERAELAAGRPAGGAVDPTGAGDAFAAGFLAAWTRGAAAGTAAGAGIQLATRAVSAIGARPEPPPGAVFPVGAPVS